MKYVLVTGGVVSSIGKGVIASSIGTLLKTCGLEVTSIKVDPYINIDAGTFSPYEHDDGGEVDLDLGNYERFLDITLHSDNNITTGKIYKHVIDKEREGAYLGKTVQVVPHITDAIQEWVERVAKKPVCKSNKEPEVCIIELGGTIGDIESMPFVEAFRQLQFRLNKDFCCVHVSLIPKLKATSEQKTKPTQSSVRELRGLGLSPDLIVCRSDDPITDAVREKTSNFCQVAREHVICIHHCNCIYNIPLMLEEQHLVEFLAERLQLGTLDTRSCQLLESWKELVEKHNRTLKEVSIALVGKYTKLADAYTSVIKALDHAALFAGLSLNLKYIDAEHLEDATKMDNPVQYHEAWMQLCSSSGIIVPGGFGGRGIEGKILAAEWSRKKNIPYLGICLGMQCAVIEFARNVLHWTGANSTEWDSNTPKPVVIDMPEHTNGNLGGTMRLGKKQSRFRASNSILRQLYSNAEYVEERHRHRYEVNPEVVGDLEACGLKFVAQDNDGVRMEMMELDGHPYYVAVQYHPEYISRPLTPSPPYLGLILASSGRLQKYLAEINSHAADKVPGPQSDVPNQFGDSHQQPSKGLTTDSDYGH